MAAHAKLLLMNEVRGLYMGCLFTSIILLIGGVVLCLIPSTRLWGYALISISPIWVFAWIYMKNKGRS